MFPVPSGPRNPSRGAATLPGTFTLCATTPRSPTNCITHACRAASRSSGIPGPLSTYALDARSQWSVPATTSRHHGAETARHGPSWPRFSTPDCGTRAANRAAAARNPSSAPAPEPSCGHVESQQPEPARRSPTCWDAQTYKHPADLNELWLVSDCVTTTADSGGHIRTVSAGERDPAGCSGSCPHCFGSKGNGIEKSAQSTGTQPLSRERRRFQETKRTAATGQKIKMGTRLAKSLAM